MSDFDPSAFVPQVHFTGSGLYGTMLVRLERCSACDAPTIAQPRHPADPFPAFHVANFDAQIRRAGWRLRSHVLDQDRTLCVPCAEAGKAAVTCALCKQPRPSSEVQESFGDPAQYLCTPCYEVTPAKAWDAKRRELEEEHRYDFE